MSKTAKPALVRGAVAVAGAALFALVLPTTATATDVPPPTVPVPPIPVAAKATMTLKIVPENPSGANPISTVTLECGPAGGTHPDAKNACATLEEVDGYFERIDPGPAFCPQYYDPVTLSATGKWGDREVVYQDVHTNRICALVATNGVFSFGIPEIGI